MFLRLLFCIGGSLFMFALSAEAKQPIYIQASKNYKKSNEYRHLMRFIRFRGLHLTTNQNDKQNICVVRTAKYICIHDQYTTKRYQNPQRIKNEELRARTLMLYLNIFLQNRQQKKRIHSHIHCKCQRNDRKKATHTKIPHTKAMQKNQREPVPKKRSFLGAKPKQKPIFKKKKQSKPSKRSVHRDRIGDKIDEREDPPDFAANQHIFHARKPRKNLPLWLAVGTASSLSFNPPTQLIVGGNAYVRLGLGAFSLHASLRLHAFSLQAQRTIFLLRPTLFMSWQPTKQSPLIKKSIQFEVHLGGSGEFFIQEPGSQSQEYTAKLEWGILIGGQVSWFWSPSWSIFLSGTITAFPFAQMSSGNQMTSPAALTQLDLSLGVQYKWSFFQQHSP